MKRTRREQQTSTKRLRILEELESEDDDAREGCSQKIFYTQPPRTEGLKKAGKLLHMHLRNFMCHGNLKLDFNERINFILGHNGAGKSVILTAAIIGLGGSAKATNRSSRIGKLIKNGEPSGSIEIHLSNEGDEGYEKDVYGERIIVIRTISGKGSSSYQIKNDRKDVISRSKAVLDLILKYFEISVDNPITVLTQDCARTFLRDSDPKARFQLFRKGVGLEAIEEELEASHSKNRAICEKLEFWRHTLQRNEDELRALRKKYSFLESVQRAKEMIIECEAELKWIHIGEEEKVLRNLTAEMARSERNLQKVQRSIDEALARNTELTDKLKKYQEEIDTKTRSLTENMTEISEKKLQVMDQKNNFFVQRKKYMAVKNRVKSTKEDLKKIDDNFDNIVNRHQRQEDMDQIKDLEAEKSHLCCRVEEIKGEIEELTSTIENLENDFETVTQHKQDLSRKAAQFKDRLQQMEKMSDNLAVYGSFMPNLLKAINRNRNRFSKLPLGPIGRYLEVPNKKYRPVIEQIISHAVSAFIVNNSKDEAELLNIFRTEFPNVKPPTILQRRFQSQVYDTSKYGVRPPPQTTLCLNEINCKEPNVLNVLIDTKHIEQILICDNMNTARKLSEHEENVPNNLKLTYVLNPMCEMYPQPSFRIYMHQRRECKYIQVSSTERKAQMKEQLNEVVLRLEDVKQKYSSIEDKTLQSKRKRKELHTKMSTMSREVSSVTEQIEELSESTSEPRFEEDALIEEKLALEKRVEELVAEEEVEKAKWEDLKGTLEVNSVDLQEKEKEFEAEEARVATMKSSIYQMEMELGAITGERSSKLTQVREFEFQLNEEKKLSEIKQIEISQLSSMAGPKVVTNRTREEVNDMIRTLRSKQKISSSMKETLQDVKLLIDDGEERHGQLNKNLTMAVDHQEELKTIIAKHIENYEHRKKAVCKKMKERFVDVLSQQNFTGKIEINYEKNVLDLEIHPRSSGTVKGTKSLSGGERSFSTIAFLLSIWSCIDHPFLLLDEYDVFTDGANREIMTNLLIKEALSTPNVQYMFITPQDMSQLIQPSAELTIFRMPNRN